MASIDKEKQQQDGITITLEMVLEMVLLKVESLKSRQISHISEPFTYC